MYEESSPPEEKEDGPLSARKTLERKTWLKGNYVILKAGREYQSGGLSLA